MAKRGRPSTYNEDIATEICARLTQGESLRKITLDEHMPTIPTVYNWFTKHPDFLNRYARAKEEQADTYADEITHIADTEPDPNRARVRIDARKWVAAKLKPKRYGEKLDMTTNGKELPAPILGPIKQGK